MAIVLYARKSVENEASISCETQLQYCRNMLRLDEQNEEIIPIVDNGCSGGNMEREGFQHMLRLVREGKISKVIVYKLDRFSRSFVDFANTMEVFRQHQVKFVSSQEAFDTGSTYGEMVMQILMVFAQFERSSIIDRVTQAYAHRSDLGFYMGGKRPFGFQLVPALIHGIPSKKLCQLPEEVVVLRRMFELYSEEALSLRSLQKVLTEEGLALRPWTSSKLSALLKNPIYVRADADVYDYYENRGVAIKGELSLFDGSFGAQLYGRSKHDPKLTDWSDMKLVLLSHEGIVASDVWLRCQRKLECNRQISRSFSNHSSWLAGKVSCALCGHTMTTIRSAPTKHGSIRRYFHCANKERCRGPQVTIYAAELEELMDGFILEKLAQLQEIKFCETPSNPAAVNELKLRLKAIEQQEKQLMTALISGELGADLLSLANEKARCFQQERRSLLERMERLLRTEEEQAVPIDPLAAWKKADVSGKKAIVGLLLHKIIIHEDGSLELWWNL